VYSEKGIRKERRQSKMRILFVDIPSGEENSETGAFYKTVLVPLLRRNLDLVKQKDTEVTFRFSNWGVDGMDPNFYGVYEHLNSRIPFYAAAHAEEEGFDAVMLGCFGDPMIWEIRQAINIPVVSPGESSMLLASLMGYKFGVVAIHPLNIIGQEHKINKYGLRERLAGIRAIPETSEQQIMAMQDCYHEIKAFKKVARELIADGAEIIIPGCALMSPALRLAPGAEKDYPQGLTEVDGVPIADVLGDTVKLAELLVSLKQAGSSWISRKGLYALPTPLARELGQKVAQDERIKFWDCR
jgi:allantoin racemase